MPCSRVLVFKERLRDSKERLAHFPAQISPFDYFEVLRSEFFYILASLDVYVT